MAKPGKRFDNSMMQEAYERGYLSPYSDIDAPEEVSQRKWKEDYPKAQWDAQRPYTENQYGVPEHPSSRSSPFPANLRNYHAQSFENPEQRKRFEKSPGYDEYPEYHSPDKRGYNAYMGLWEQDHEAMNDLFRSQQTTGLSSSLQREAPQPPEITLREQEEVNRWESSELDQIKKHEGGFYPEVYPDSLDIDTIGYGFNLERPEAQNVLDNAGIYKSVADLRSKKESLTSEEAEILIRLEYPEYEASARDFVGSETWDSMPKDKQNVLTNMSFNLGNTGLNEFDDLRTALQAGDYTEAAAAMHDSTWRSQVKTRATEPVTGLIARMKASDQMAANAPMNPDSDLQAAIARALGSVMEQGG